MKSGAVRESTRGGLLSVAVRRGPPAAGRAVWTRYLTVAARLGLAAVWLIAGAAKAGDLAHSGRVINAYRILPYDVATTVGAALPFVELALGVLLLLGFATRLVAGVSAAMLVAFIGGIVWVWAHGYQIDCGCFGGGGALSAGQDPTYLLDVLRDLGFLLLAGFLLARPHGWLAIDNWLRGEPQLPQLPHRQERR